MRALPGISLGLAACFLVLALKGIWGGAWLPDGTQFKVGLYGTLHVFEPTNPASPVDARSWWLDSGSATCRPNPAHAIRSVLFRAVFPIMSLAFGCTVAALFSARSRRRLRFTALALVAAAGGTVAAWLTLPFSLAALATIPFHFGSLAFVSALLAIGSLLTAIILTRARAATGFL